VGTFRDTFLWGHVLGVAAQREDFTAAVDRWVKCRTPESTEKSEALKLLHNTLWGNVPDDVVQQHLLLHLDRLATQIGTRLEIRRIAMAPVDVGSGAYDEVRERLPWIRSNPAQGIRIELPGSVISVSRVRAVDASGTVAWTVPASAVQIIDARGGVLFIAERALHVGLAPAYLAQRGATNLFSSALRLNTPDMVPGYWAVDYVTGPATGKRVGHFPIAVKFQIWCQAAKALLALHSNVTTRGVSSQSRNVDGIQNSIQLAADINAPLEAVLDDYGRVLDTKMLRRRMRGIPCAPL